MLVSVRLIRKFDNIIFIASANYLKRLLAFAVGGLLGDVFLHSLPEIWEREIQTKGELKIRFFVRNAANIIFFRDRY